MGRTSGSAIDEGQPQGYTAAFTFRKATFLTRMSRRHFVQAAAAGVAASSSRVLAAARLPAFALRNEADRYDLIIRDGRVIDPASGLDGIRDVAISSGRIAAVKPSITADAADTINARGKLVVPGLIDIHTHC